MWRLGHGMNEVTGLQFAHFEVRRRDDGVPWELGRGAMGVTYKAFDPQLRLDVALKVINPAQVGDSKAQALFLREARAAARVHHANVGSVVYLNQDPQNMFYAMEFIAGESLRDWLHSRVPLTPLMAIGLTLQVARGLEAIHREEVVHRDLKPANLMMVRLNKQRPETDPEAWQVKIIDFGLARNVAGEVSETSAAANTTGFRGTALYASPEQCEERRDLDGRSDLYSLGCVMWEMLVGAPPFRANVHRELLNAHVAKPPPLQQLSHLPLPLQAVVVRLLLKDREARFADCDAVIRALEKCGAQIERGDAPVPTNLGDALAATTGLPEPAMNMPREARRGGDRARLFAVIAMGAALLALGSGLAWKKGWLSGSVSTDDWRSRWTNPIVAVLPFEGSNLNDKEQALANALTTQVTNQLGGLPSTRVIPESAIRAARKSPGGMGQNRIRSIDAEFGGVSAVLENSISKQGRDYTINSVLYDARTEKRLWGHTYLRAAANAGIEQEVPEQIVRALRTRLAAAAREIPGRTAAGAVTAADLYFQAVDLDIFDPRRAELLEQVVVMDPSFADAYVELAVFAANQRDANIAKGGSREEQLLKVNALTDKAVALDPISVNTQVIKALVLQASGDTKQANEMIDRVLQAAPNHVRANVIAGFRAENREDFAEAYAYLRKARSIDPGFRRLPYRLYWRASEAGLKDLAAYWLGKILATTVDMQARELIVAQQLFDRGEYDAALEQLNLLPPDLEKEFFSAVDLRRDSLWRTGRYDELLRLGENAEDGIEQSRREYWRAILLWHLGRTNESIEAAGRALMELEKSVAAVKSRGETPRMSLLYLAQMLEILGRAEQAKDLVKQFVQLKSIPERDYDVSIFRNSPETLAMLIRRQEKDREKLAAVARRILEIERSYSGDETPQEPQ